MATDEPTLEKKFDSAVRVIWNLPEDGPYQQSDEMMLMFYSYYMQATDGPCNIPRPGGHWDTAGKAKWDAWNSLGNMTKEEAMMAYVEDIQLILETIPVTEEVSDLLALLGNFYEEVEGGEEEEEEEDKRAFRPFASIAAESQWPHQQKPLMDGFGDLWEVMQSPDCNINGMVMNGNEKSNAECKEESKTERKVESESEEESSDLEEEEEDAEDEAEMEEEEEEKEEIRDRRVPDPRLLRVEDFMWRSEAILSNDSAETSLSSMTDVTHSSLKSDVEEEELACTQEPPLESQYRHMNGHLSDYSNVLPELNHRTNDSDSEEFCDSMEHLAMEEGSGAARVHLSRTKEAQGRRDLREETKTTLNEGEDMRLQGGHDAGHGLDEPCSSLLRTGGGSRSSGISSQPLCISEGVAGSNLHEQVVVALWRLQEDMTSVLQRLNTLKALTAAQASSLSLIHNESLPQTRKRPSWWPFRLSPTTVVFSTVWPLVAHWLVQLYFQRQRRKVC